MAFVSMKELLTEAKEQHYAIGQFNINGLQWTKAILQAAEEERSPVIAAASDRLIDYLGGFKTVAAMVGALVEELSITVPVVLHLDHGSSAERCRQAIDAGFSSVMIDGSHFPIDENIAMTKEVVSYARLYGVSVEAEVGTVGGMEDGLIGGVKYADLHECIRLVKETDIDALAAALGSVHGKYQGEPKLGFKEMEEISEATDVPLVLHGASGIPADQIARAIRLGHAKININTECMVAWTEKTRTMFKENLDLYEPRAYMTPGIGAVKETVKNKMREFGSAGKAAGAREMKV
ncbi:MULTISPECIES: class II fructose-1,6-bisphosphate aldolase [Bacillus]|uniref:Class II fructose-1,6-bisphosphate aldolase n=1 Tax=Bacillus glycinifermentans TaxID=1664069 RepID=A0AAJ4D507_9BACI|nr:MULTISPECIES: class II fructose-1,6-bisphosphate aldolase [Bacillus]KKB74011.1 6-phospho-5-dehydro-2-deoxy-D-gluconate aldolase [Bacillus sp. TH008]MBU8786161.1 class II fructose-1,6-bisphosphate aldolase [Bacillus glycinifermentans]MDU0070231.1 class II fructose-1,6-bisphosphate aldolase [Bacillus sp. IG6]MED8017835.1 class II fructose-1,6-bisphosphate aldolase [Bacillus glycinifermentans]NUJ16680.1 class II fructose-1,6-bisphosphate aldolase [Bacillus glycinifermentans]